VDIERAFDFGASLLALILLSPLLGLLALLVRLRPGSPERFLIALAQVASLWQNMGWSQPAPGST